MWSANFSNFVTIWMQTFLVCLPLVQISKNIRSKRGALFFDLCIGDVIFVALFSLVGSIFSSIFAIQFLSLALVQVWCIFLFIDALLFVQYRIELTPQSIQWFFSGSKGIQKGSSFALNLVKQNLWMTVLLWGPLLLLIVAPNSHLLSAAILTSIVLIGGVTLKYKLSLKTPYSAVLLAILCMFFQPFIPFGSDQTTEIVVSLLPILPLVIHFYLLRGTAFYSAPSTLASMFFGSLKDSDLADVDTSQIAREFEGKGKSNKSKNKSDLFGLCKNANVILITVESLGAYVKPYKNASVDMKTLQNHFRDAMFSEHHYCLCPNTTVATNQIYTGHYSNNPYNKNDSVFYGKEPLYLQELNSNNYFSMFLDLADIKLYDYWKLLKRIGFDKIWGTNDLPSKGLKADYRLLNMVDEVAGIVNSKERPFFLHIINDQTHMPYEVVNSEKFNRHKDGSEKSKYLNAVEEFDFILDEFLTKLKTKVDLSNTIFVLTGDHGESFGEFGYYFHSNSSIIPQLQVPFFLQHPKLANRPKNKFESSCHFDIFPTLMDLLGIENKVEGLGESLFCSTEIRPYFFHSATLKGNAPANYSVLYNNQHYWNDRLFGKLYQFDNGELVKKTNEVYQKSILVHFLKKYGLVGN
ncbi:sulfatase-like hydrolase/transferase [Catenovulum sp. SX2]|uniref:sulfatase-like hydrolase/transferase n=1 Tax=Catenovulum sp. SX2 TaxID=3398614 RepID=UPI003F8642A3